MPMAKSVMDISSTSGKPKNPAKPQELGLYFKTQAHTASLEVSIERKDGGSGTVFVPKASLIDYDSDRKETPPTCNLDEYMEPIWAGTTVHNETVLMLSESGAAPSGRLMFQPDRILSIRDSSLKTEFTEGTDYVVNGSTITCAPPIKDALDEGRGGFLRESSLGSGVAGRHVAVTYIHHGKWDQVPSRSIAEIRCRRRCAAWLITNR